MSTTQDTKPQNGTPMKNRVDNLMREAASRKASFQRLLPKGLDAEWFLGEVRVALARTPKLAECDMVSVFDALTTCAQIGLSPSGRLGSAYLIPYGTKCTLVIGYKGYVDLAYRSGDVVGFGAQVVHANDDFTAREGFDIEVEHRRTEGEPGELRAVYAWATLRGGYTVKVLMWAREVLAIKAKAPGASKSDSPWRTNEAEMWRKTAIRRLIKLLPLSPTKAQGLYKAQEAEDAEWEVVDVEPAPEATPAPSRTAAVKTRLMTEGQPRMTIEPPPEAAMLPQPPDDMVLPGQRVPGQEG